MSQEIYFLADEQLCTRYEGRENMANDIEILRHKEWLGLLQPVGLVVSPPALAKAQAVINRAKTVELQIKLNRNYSAIAENIKLRFPPNLQSRYLTHFGNYCAGFKLLMLLLMVNYWVNLQGKTHNIFTVD